MIDEHIIPANWGVKPVLFSIGNINIPSYSFFVALAVVVGGLVYYYEAKRNKSTGENTFYILMAAFVGGVLGAKIPIWIMNYKYIIASFPDIGPLLSGRTIVGGLIGGTIGVWILKWKLNIKERKGNLFAPAAAIGIAIGRIGCFLRGCCYGTATSLPWGVNFGDGIMRHPTQLYESVFAFGMFLYIQRVKKNAKPGKLFDMFMISYFTFRFFEEFIREESRPILGFTIFQIICAGVLLTYLIKALVENYKSKKSDKR